MKPIVPGVTALIATAAFGAPACAQLAEAPATQAEAVLRELERNRGMAVSRSEGQLLHGLVKEIDARNVVEIGTFRGYSGTWISLALCENRRPSGHL